MLTGNTRIKLSQILRDGRPEAPEGSTSPDGTKIKKDGEWIPISKEKKEMSPSSQRAKELSLDMWGTPEEVDAIATPKRKAKTYEEAREIMNQFIGKEYRSKSGLPGTISKKSIDKMLSGKAGKTSFLVSVHSIAAVNIDKLYSNSIEPFEAEKDRDNNTSIKAIHRTYAPLKIDIDGKEKIIPVKFTVKEYTDKNKKNKLYSVEAIDFDYTDIKKGNAGNLAGDRNAKSGSGARRPLDTFPVHNITQDNKISNPLLDLFLLAKKGLYAS